jgi:tetratricopeptide (TPR) repeat protein
LTSNGTTFLSVRAYSHQKWGISYPPDLNRAIDDATAAIRLDPEFVDAYCNRGIAYYHRSTQMLHFVEGESFEIKQQKAAVAKRQDSDRAIDDLTQAIRLDPNSVKAFACRASAYLIRAVEGDNARFQADRKRLEQLKRP